MGVIPHRGLLLFGALLVFSTPYVPPGLAHAAQQIHHAMQVSVTPTAHVVRVEDTVTFPKHMIGGAERTFTFILHAGLNLSTPTRGATIVQQPGPQAAIFLNSYTLTLPADAQMILLHYEGEIYHPLVSEGEEYARSFTETPGLISAEGVYLAGSTAWYPQFGDHLMSFTMDVELPAGWSAVSQGKRTRRTEHDDTAHIRWESPEPQDEIFLIAGIFTEYSAPAGSVEVMAFLKTPDEALANTYLTTTTQYLEMYSNLLGPYLYSKFALVENFWETGYGMPSFTLLGPKVIRFPFIRHSSYPHEILHNWWGRGVYVDFKSGNWSEGLTAYLADHLIKEQRGTAVEYRRNTLQQYADYVADATDFPLTEFRSRHSAVTQAVGYGKTLMFFHMLRQQLGDDVFVAALRAFYRDNTFRHATYANLKHAFEHASGHDLTTPFTQWVDRPGAPAIHVSHARAERDGATYRLTAILEQTQSGPPYTLNIPIAITRADQKGTYQTTVSMASPQHTLDLQVPFRPVHLHVDPEFDVFRRLDRNETPPALTQAFGASKVLILLPSRAPTLLREGYRELAASWQASQPGAVDIKMDDEVDHFPSDHGVWLFGWDNQFRDHTTTALSDYEVTITNENVHIDSNLLSRDTQSIFLSARRADHPDLPVTWVAAHNVRAMPGLGRKLPHYGKYSYLGFEGDDPTNILKGQWPIVDSPMTIPIHVADGPPTSDPSMQLAPRHALATLPELFSEERMMHTIEWLADDPLQGRGLGTPELDRVTEFLVEAFRKAGLKPGEPNDSYIQTWNANIGTQRDQVAMHNVVGIIPGTKPEFSKQSVVIGAHYDHLGLGWPDVHVGDEGKIHHGADDNASGIAVLLELARILSQQSKPERTIVFIAFTGEEDGLRGSRHYVENARRFPANHVMGMLNLDTVGRLENKKLLVIGTGSAREWGHVFMGAGYVTGVRVESVATDFGSSDQQSFLDAGIPAVQFFTGPHLDYHRPTDTIDKIDSSGLVSVAKVAKEAIEYLSSRPDTLTSTLRVTDSHASGGTTPTRSERRVHLGTIPDFTYQDTGVRITGTTPGSPAEKAGLQAEDVIIRLGDTPIDDLRFFSQALATLQPGDTILITVTREGTKHTTQATVVER